jgi:hypothetical protein
MERSLGLEEFMAAGSIPARKTGAGSQWSLDILLLHHCRSKGQQAPRAIKLRFGMTGFLNCTTTRVPFGKLRAGSRALSARVGMTGF